MFSSNLRKNPFKKLVKIFGSVCGTDEETKMNTNSTQPFAKMVLHFIRKNGGPSSNDDTITIQPKWRALSTNEDISLLEYVVSTEFAALSMAGHKPQKNHMRLMGNQLMTYVENLLNLSLLDDEPFESIQVDAPCVPSVLLKLDSVPDAVQSILQIMQVCISNWPTACTPQTNVSTNQPQQRTGRHIIFADDGASTQAVRYNEY
jgi:hypothetical protein